MSSSELKNGSPTITVTDAGEGFNNLAVVTEDENAAQQSIDGLEMNKIGPKRSSLVSWGDNKTVSS